MTRKSAGVDGLNPNSNFRYLLSTQQQQVVDSVEIPPLPSFHKFPSISRCKMNAYPGIPKREQGLAEKNRNLPRTCRLSRRNIPEKVSSTLNEKNFRIPSGDLANEQSRRRNTLGCNFREIVQDKNNQSIMTLNQKFIVWSNYNILASFQTEDSSSLKLSFQ